VHPRAGVSAQQAYQARLLVWIIDLTSLLSINMHFPALDDPNGVAKLNEIT
jgi:hypothetical protein